MCYDGGGNVLDHIDNIGRCYTVYTRQKKKKFNKHDCEQFKLREINLARETSQMRQQYGWFPTVEIYKKSKVSSYDQR